MKTNYVNLAILTFFCLLLATENLKNHFFFDFLISLFGEISPVKNKGCPLALCL
jgi:hypothetical protein